MDKLLWSLKYSKRAQAALQQVKDRILQYNKLVPPGFRTSVIGEYPMGIEEAIVGWLFSIAPQTAPDRHKRCHEWQRSLIVCSLTVDGNYNGKLYVAGYGEVHKMIWMNMVEAPEYEDVRGSFINEGEAELAARQMLIFAADYDSVAHTPDGSHRMK